MNLNATLADTIEALVYQTSAQGRNVTLHLSFTASAPAEQKEQGWNGIDSIFMKDVAANH